jgi:hypothetical protein
MIITDIEKIEHEDMIIYWLGDDESDDNLGVAFRPCVANIANQGQAESVAFALVLAGDAVDKALTQTQPAWVVLDHRHCPGRLPDRRIYWCKQTAEAEAQKMRDARLCPDTEFEVVQLEWTP